MADRPYSVGYGKPPREHQFKPGHSGNVQGRPKGATGFRADVEAALGSRITVTESGRKKKITVAAAALKRLIQKAVIDGDQRAIERLLALAQQADPGVVPPPTTITPDDQVLIDDFLARHTGDAS
jgi:hypothetical protein